MGKFTGKVALVTASTEGIGFAIARRLGQDGAHVVVCSRKEANVNKAIQTLKSEDISVSGMPYHVGKPSDRKALLDKIKNEQGGIDILVCNAASKKAFGNILDSNETAFDEVFNENVKSMLMLIKESIPFMENRRNPSIVTVGSLWGLVTMNTETSSLNAVSQAAAMCLAKALRYALSSKGIRINSIAPAFITPEVIKFEPSAERSSFNFLVLRRTGIPKECAGTVSYLCSDDAAYVTGETVVIAGGAPSRL